MDDGVDPHALPTTNLSAKLVPLHDRLLSFMTKKLGIQIVAPASQGPPSLVAPALGYPVSAARHWGLAH